jgi:hypothetical protein
VLVVRALDSQLANKLKIVWASGDTKAARSLNRLSVAIRPPITMQTLKTFILMYPHSRSGRTQ